MPEHARAAGIGRWTFMRHRNYILCLALLLAGFTACTNTTAVQNHPIVPLNPGPVPADLQPTRANAKLRRDVLANIAAIQQARGGASPSLIGVKPIATSDGATKETWFIRERAGAVRYDVTMTPSAAGGTDFSITGPLE